MMMMMMMMYGTHQLPDVDGRCSHGCDTSETEWLARLTREVYLYLLVLERLCAVYRQL